MGSGLPGASLPGALPRRRAGLPPGAQRALVLRPPPRDGLQRGCGAGPRPPLRPASEPRARGALRQLPAGGGDPPRRRRPAGPLWPARSLLPLLEPVLAAQEPWAGLARPRRSRPRPARGLHRSGGRLSRPGLRPFDQEAGGGPWPGGPGEIPRLHSSGGPAGTDGRRRCCDSALPLRRVVHDHRRRQGARPQGARLGHRRAP